MFWKYKQSFFKWLDTGGRRQLVARISNIESALRGDAARYSVDGDGHWVNRQSEFVFVSPDIFFCEEKNVMPRTIDTFCHQYTIQPGDTVLDIGAGIGDETLAFSKMVGPKGRVISVEASPTVFRCLEKTIASSKLTNVTAICAAITEKKGTVIIEDCKGADHIENSIFRSRTDGIEVPSLSIPDLLKQCDVKKVDLLKMNIEGAERQAMQGMGPAFDSIRNHVISCHDFVADEQGAEELRTFAEVKSSLDRPEVEIVTRRSDSRPWIRYFLYARNIAAA